MKSKTKSPVYENTIILFFKKYSGAQYRYWITAILVVLSIVSLIEQLKILIAVLSAIISLILLFLQYLNEGKNTHEKIFEYIKDIEHWDLDNLVYLPDSDCRIVCHEDTSIPHSYLNQIECYHPILVDLYLNDDIWNKKKCRMDCSCEEHFCFYDVEIYYRNSCILRKTVSKLLLKHYPSLNVFDIFYIPTELVEKKVKNRQAIISLPDFDICKILYKQSNGGEDENSKVLDLLNYDYLADPSGYFNANKNAIYAKRG